MMNNLLNIKKFYLFTIAILLLLCLIIMILSAFITFVDQPPYSYLTKFDNVINLVSVVVLGCVAFLFSIYSYCKNKEQTSIKKEFQKKILFDIIGRMYRNKIYIYAIMYRMEEKEYDYYPSEKYHLFFKIPFVNILLEKFDCPDEYDNLFKLSQRLEIYNQMCDVRLKYFKTKDKEQKKSDMKILNNQTTQIAVETMKFMCKIGFLPPAKKNKEDTKHIEAEKVVKKHFEEEMQKMVGHEWLKQQLDETVLNTVSNNRIQQADVFFDKKLGLTKEMNEAIVREIPGIELMSYK